MLNVKEILNFIDSQRANKTDIKTNCKWEQDILNT